MTQHAYARALNLLADNGIDPDTARYIMKRLHDFGYEARRRDPGPGGTSPPAHRITRTEAITRARAAVDAAKEKAEADRIAGLAAEAKARAAEDAARARQLAVAKVLSAMT